MCIYVCKQRLFHDNTCCHFFLLITTCPNQSLPSLFSFNSLYVTFLHFTALLFTLTSLFLHFRITLTRLLLDFTSHSVASRSITSGDSVVYQKDLAQSIKQELDKQKGGVWNVIVGKSFGSFVTHETKTISYFCIGSLSFLVWRHG